VIVGPIAILITFLIIQAGMLYMAKLTLNNATFMAARYGATQNAKMSEIQSSLAKGLIPFYQNASNNNPLTRIPMALAYAEGAVLNPLIVKIEILSPSQEAFDTYGIQDGSTTYIPNDNLEFRTPTPMNKASISIRDANILRIKVTYGYELKVPLMQNLLKRIMCGNGNSGVQAWDGRVPLMPLDLPNCAYYEQGRIPIVSYATVQMQSNAISAITAHSQFGGVPVVRQDSACLINCNAAGEVGAKGKVVTEVKPVAGGKGESGPQPNAALQKLINEANDKRSLPEKAKDADTVSGALDAPQKMVAASVKDQGDFWERYRIGTRVTGAVQLVLGTAGAAGAVIAGCGSIVACGLGAVGAAVSADYALAGARQLWTGEATSPMGEQGLESLGLSPTAASLTYGAIGMTSSVGPALGAAAAKGINAAERFVAGKGGIAAADISVPGRVQSRINIANGRTRTTPLRDNGNPVSAGFNHVLDGHFNVNISNSRSVFTISPDELKGILQSKSVVHSPVTALPNGQFVRTVDVGRTIGTTTIKDGGVPTSIIKIFTDKAGNLITAFPVKGGN
jgi:hypothetical protein